MSDKINERPLRTLLLLSRHQHLGVPSLISATRLTSALESRFIAPKLKLCQANGNSKLTLASASLLVTTCGWLTTCFVELTKISKYVSPSLPNSYPTGTSPVAALDIAQNHESRNR